MAQDLIQMEDCTVLDDRPIAVRRKRRSSTALANPVPQQKIEPSDDSHVFPPESTTTPSKPKKKVRFSDPGPEAAGPSSSTGLTPAFNRTSFGPFRPQPTSNPHSHKPRRLASLPDVRVAALPSPPPSLSPAPHSGEIQIIPWCDIMDDRSKRRLKRNHMSEVQNEWEAAKKPETKPAAQYEREIRGLRSELASMKKHQLHGEAEGASSALKGVNRERELEVEIDRLKQEMNDREPTAEPQNPIDSSYAPATAAPTVAVDDLDEALTESLSMPDIVLEHQAAPTPPQYTEASTQASLRDPRQAEMLRSARLRLEYLFPGEIALGLVQDNPQPLLDIMMERLDTMRMRALIAEDSLTTTQAQESNIRTQFNKTLEQLERARKYSAKASVQHKDDKARADTAESNATVLQAKADVASNRVRELETSVDEKHRSIAKLQQALESYRVEVGKLENLIENIESDHNAQTAKLRSEMDEAVADLECHVAAETSGRREAEAEVERKDQKIKELQVRERELRDAVNEKQRTIRNIEVAFTKESTARERAERENGLLNVQVNQLRHNLHNSDKRYEQADQMREILTRKIEEERAAALRALAAVQDEMTQCQKNTEGIQSAHVHDSKKRSADVMEHKGLLTPTTGGRFRDLDEIEGLEGLEVQRGKKVKGRKKRPDSGVVILEEDEDEDMVMNDY